LVHYELGNYEFVLSQIDSYKHFIRRSKTISRERKQEYRDFIFYVERLVKFINNRNKSYMDSIMMKIKNTERIPNKNWLFEKAKELSVSKAKAA